LHRVFSEPGLPATKTDEPMTGTLASVFPLWWVTVIVLGLCVASGCACVLGRDDGEVGSSCQCLRALVVG
jgi:hypothetical protein